ncbi:hypothetical protein H5410_042721 [Solanum commersonii]|uniref:Uncharacterized protein n=1 Tax=Solanum commersonii TaxID=4109 RepID=A0A9J5XX59_SOLCO|nr:hypothetical protein H5410_042721 [Solanum commersonii]
MESVVFVTHMSLSQLTIYLLDVYGHRKYKQLELIRYYWNNRKHWSKVKKDIVAALWRAMVYLTWRVRNWKIYRGVNVQNEQVITQIKQEFIDRTDRLQESKKLYKCRNFI